jgi:hypothetical protein
VGLMLMYDTVSTVKFGDTPELSGPLIPEPGPCVVPP